MRNDAIKLSTESIKPYMCCDKMLPSAQGMSIYGDYVFQLYHTGYCAVYDLGERRSAPLAFFPLASVNEGVPSKDYINHANQCMFSTLHVGDNDLPLLYVTTGNGIGADEDGFFYRCAVENIRLMRDDSGAVIGGSSELIQTYSYLAGDEEKYGWCPPCFGCPAWFVDSEKGFLYIFSAKYRTTKEYAQFAAENRYIITKFCLHPPQEGGLIRLGAEDILQQFSVPFDVFFTQGGMLHDDKIFYTFGFGNETYPDALHVYDLREKKLLAKMDLSDSVLKGEEIECCSFYGDELICNTNVQPVKLYSLGKLTEIYREKGRGNLEKPTR